MSRLRAALLVAACTAGVLAVPAADVQASTSRGVLGVTLDTTAHLSATMDSLAHLPRRARARVVFDVDRDRPSDAQPYVDPVRRISTVADVMGSLADSSELPHLTVAQMRARAQHYVSRLGSHVAIWEIGNEVNGSWTGNASAVARKVIAGYDVVHAAGARTALTLYYNVGCEDTGELRPATWAQTHLPPRVRNGLNEVLLSYYEPECDYRRPSLATWTSYFRKLRQLFPHARVGFGEVGLPDPATSATSGFAATIVQRYYNLRVPLSYFNSGCYYWYFAEDMVPRSKPLFTTLVAASS